MEEKETGFIKKLVNKLRNFKFEEFIYKNRVPVVLFLFGAIMVGLGVFYIQSEGSLDKSEIEILESESETEKEVSVLIVEIAGAVEKPGVYELEGGSRVEDILIAAGGLSANADRDWMEKYVNRAAKLIDGQKLYIKRVDDQTIPSTANNGGVYQNGSSVLSGQGSAIVNINTASQKELESLWGIGPVYAQNIIEGRPYSSVEELLSRKIIKSNVYERNKDKFSIY